MDRPLQPISTMQHLEMIFDAETLSSAALHALRQSDKVGALRLAIDAQAVALRAAAPADRRADALHRAAVVFHALDEHERCEAASRAALATEADCDRPVTRAAYALYLAYVLREGGKLEEAALFAERAAALYARALGLSHPVTLSVRADVARMNAEASTRPRAS